MLVLAGKTGVATPAVSVCRLPDASMNRKLPPSLLWSLSGPVPGVGVFIPCDQSKLSLVSCIQPHAVVNGYSSNVQSAG
jgi:hypothetical protein